MKRKTKQDLDALAAVCRKISPGRLEKVLVKSCAITIRVTESDRETMKRAAKKCGLTVTEYLIRLHGAALEKMKYAG